MGGEKKKEKESSEQISGEYKGMMINILRWDHMSRGTIQHDVTEPVKTGIQGSGDRTSEKAPKVVKTGQWVKYTAHSSVAVSEAYASLYWRQTASLPHCTSAGSWPATAHAQW